MAGFFFSANLLDTNDVDRRFSFSCLCTFILYYMFNFVCLFVGVVAQNNLLPGSFKCYCLTLARLGGFCLFKCFLVPCIF